MQSVNNNDFSNGHVLFLMVIFYFEKVEKIWKSNIMMRNKFGHVLHRDI